MNFSGSNSRSTNTIMFSFIRRRLIACRKISPPVSTKCSAYGKFSMMSLPAVLDGGAIIVEEAIVGLRKDHADITRQASCIRAIHGRPAAIPAMNWLAIPDYARQPPAWRMLAPLKACARMNAALARRVLHAGAALKFSQNDIS